MIIDSTQYNGMCACGWEHKMETVLSVVESGCLKQFEQYASQLGHPWIPSWDAAV